MTAVSALVENQPSTLEDHQYPQTSLLVPDGSMSCFLVSEGEKANSLVTNCGDETT